MTEELQVLRDVVTRLESAGMDYMLTGSVALNCHAQPRMTRDIDLVVAFFLRDASRIQEVLGPDYYVSPEAAREAVLHQSSFNAIHEASLIKVDLMVRKLEDYRLHEFARRVRMRVEGFDLWVVSKEDLIQAGLGAQVALRAAARRCGEPHCQWMRHGYLKTWSAALNLTDMLTRVLP